MSDPIIRDYLEALAPGDIVYLPAKEGAPPNGPRALTVFGRVLEVSGPVAMVRWTEGPGLRYCGVGGGWYALEDLRPDPRLVCISDRYEGAGALAAGMPYDCIGDFLRMCAACFPEEHITIDDFSEDADGVWHDATGPVLELYQSALTRARAG